MARVIKLAGVLSLNPEDEKRIHPDALKWFSARKAEIQCEVPLEELSDDDLNIYLWDDEKREFQSYMKEIAKGLVTCVDIGDRDSPQPFTSDIILLRFEINLLSPMFRIQLLLKKVYDRKAKKAREEQKKREEAAEAERQKKEEEERWWAAYKALNIPADDAFKYLKVEEHQEFADSFLGAVDAYLVKGESYTLDSRADDYLFWISVINSRRKKEERKTAAQFAAGEFNHRLNQEITKLTSLLDHNIKDHSIYFQKEIKDSRYTSHNFDYLLSNEERQAFDNIVITIARRELDKLVSNDLSQFVDKEYRHIRRTYFLLPSIDYSFKGVPCLDFSFDIFAVVCREIWLKPRQKRFGDHIFDLPLIEEKGCSILLQQPKLLGYHYLVLRPEEFGGHMFWKTIPLVLLEGLMNGELQPAGTTILRAWADGRTYRIMNFKEEVTILKNFENYLKKIGNIEQMVSIGIMDQEVANIIQKNLSQSATEGRTRLFQNGQAAGFTDEELISSLTSLGFARKTAEELSSGVPRDLSLDEAIRFALQNHSEIVAQ